jgi:hypothetical protein
MTSNLPPGGTARNCHPGPAPYRSLFIFSTRGSWPLRISSRAFALTRCPGWGARHYESSWDSGGNYHIMCSRGHLGVVSPLSLLTLILEWKTHRPRNYSDILSQVQIRSALRLRMIHFYENEFYHLSTHNGYQVIHPRPYGVPSKEFTPQPEKRRQSVFIRSMIYHH